MTRTRLAARGAAQPREVMMSPTKRRQLQAKVQDDIEADNIVTILMGDPVEPRRDFIETNALNVRNLDV